jgi:hypothetical protein
MLMVLQRNGWFCLSTFFDPISPFDRRNCLQSNGLGHKAGIRLVDSLSVLLQNLLPARHRCLRSKNIHPDVKEPYLSGSSLYMLLTYLSIFINNVKVGLALCPTYPTATLVAWCYHMILS